MIAFPDIDPVAIQLGPIAVHWYGISYIVGIGLGWWLLSRAAGRNGYANFSKDEVADLVFYCAIGAVLGGRMGYVVFYNFAEFLAQPAAIFAVWRGGMSFHGGALGGIVAMAVFARRRGHGFFVITDFVMPVAPVGLFCGRLANFVNQELWGAPTSLPWGVLFTHPAAGGVARHPSQLYEAGLEGLLLFVLLQWVARRVTAVGVVSATFLVGYGVMRALVEFVREPDQHIGYLAWGWLTMGQVLSLPMIVAGIIIYIWSSRRGDVAPA